MTAHSSPTGYNALSAYLVVASVDAQLKFLKDAFGAVLLERMEGSSAGEHAEVRIDDTVLMMGAGPDVEPSNTMLHLYVDDVDAVYEAAVRAGASTREKPARTEYGQRRCAVVDPSGNTWFIATADAASS